MSELIGLIYESISSDAGFQPFLDALVQVLDCRGAFIAMKPMEEPVLAASWVSNISMSVVGYYSDTLNVSGSEGTQLQTSPGVSEIVVAASEVEPRHACFFGVQCRRGQESFQSRELAVIEVLLSHVERAVAIHVKLSEHVSRGENGLKRLTEKFGFTSAEAQIASQLMAGKSLSDIASMSRRSRETVKYHLRNMFRKTDTCRQVELVSLLARH
ncbi:helix-turn-helix transcriptional regulator [Marinobacter litoralis]|uniref:helix-turn-helix transcriptional regulator n=1 Tax=Marinobacter litoralis TaxID=187981 RepID=UPI001D0D9DB6|nr:helix-turn-helix transcriptional regulator [Marinobacter litoralis]